MLPILILNDKKEEPTACPKTREHPHLVEYNILWNRGNDYDQGNDYDKQENQDMKSNIYYDYNNG